MKKFLKIGGIVVGAIVVFATVVSFLYWQSLKDEPQYALASIVDAARRNDDAALNELVDSDAVVDSFVPQVTKKAVDIYGRGMSPNLITKIAIASAPFIPGLKGVVRSELPKLIRRETERVGNVSFPLMVLGAPRYLDILVDGDIANIKSTNPEHQTEVIMRRNEEGNWQVIGVRDEKMATQIAQRVGQEIIGMADGSKDSSIDRLIKQIEKVMQ